MNAIDLRALSRQHMPELPELPADGAPAIAAMGIETWHRRMVNEYSSSRVFEGLARQLADAGFEGEEIEAVREFAEEERRHGVLCGAVVEALGGEARAELLEPTEYPTHEDVSPREAVLRNLLSISCMSETIAVSLIGAERMEMTPGPLHDLLTRIWSDEIGHARFGWRIVHREIPKLDAAARARLDAFLVVALAHLEEHELAHLPASSCPPAGGNAIGLCSGADARVLFFETVEQVILPRLEALGLRARLAWSRRAMAHAIAS